MRCCRPNSSRLAEAGLAGAARRDRRRLRDFDGLAGKNIGRRGEDIVAGTTVLDAGRVLRPQDVGVMSSIGLDQRQRRPAAARAAGHHRQRAAPVRLAGRRGFHITDANGPMLAALAERDGAVVDFPGLVRDDADAILGALQADADVVIVSGGSSVGIEDLAPMLVAAHGELAVHGIAMRPSSPTGMGTIGPRLVFLLPGNPVSALCAYDFFAGRAIRALGGRSKAWPYRSVRATLARKISSPIGRLDYARVRLEDGRVEPLSVAGASVLSSTTRADGFVIVGDDSEGFAAGSRRRCLALCVSRPSPKAPAGGRSSSSRSSIATRRSGASARPSI